MRKGKTTSDKDYVNHDSSLVHMRATKRKHDLYRSSSGTSASLGETTTVVFVKSDLKQRIRDVATQRREHRTPANMAALDALFLEARAAGWSTHQIGRAAFSAAVRVSARFTVLDARAVDGVSLSAETGTP